MSFSQQLLFHVPPLFLCVIMLLFSMILSVAGLLITRAFISHQKLKVHNDVAGPIFSTLGVIYAVILAFVVVITWENYDRAGLNVSQEANCLVDLYLDAGSFSEPSKNELRTLLQEYDSALVNDEWPLLAQGKFSLKVDGIVQKIWKSYGSYTPKSMTDEVFFKESVHKLNSLGEMRRMRLLDSRNGLPSLLWSVLIIGGVITVMFVFFFGTENFRAQLVMTVLLAALIALILFTILALDFPFTGAMSIKPIALIQMFSKM
jgi:hypothetical protein